MSAIEARPPPKRSLQQGRPAFRHPYRFFFDDVNDPSNGLTAMTLPFAGGLEVVVKG